MKKLFFVCILSACSISALLADETNAVSRKAALEEILKVLNRPPKESELWMGHHPGWYDTSKVKELADFAVQYRNTDEALTAELWLVIVQTGVGQTNNGAALRNVMRTQAAAFYKIITKAPNSWQAKIARLLRCGALLQARQWDEFHGAVDQTLSSIIDYSSESNEEYHRCLQTLKIHIADIEPELRSLRINAACDQGKLDKALQYAEELQSKFPEWSKRNSIASQISMLKRGESPYGAR